MKEHYTPVGLASQISNMVTGLERKREKPPKGPTRTYYGEDGTPYETTYPEQKDN